MNMDQITLDNVTMGNVIMDIVTMDQCAPGPGSQGHATPYPI